VAAATCAAAVAAVVGECAWSRLCRRGEPARGWTARRFLSSLAAGAVVLGLQHAGAIAPWRPSGARLDPQRIFWEAPHE
jgi:hypothetical protein